MRWVTAFLVWAAASGLVASAGNLTPPAGPDDPASALPTFQDLHDRLTTGTNAPLRTGGVQPPATSPAPTGVTLDDLFAAAPAIATNPALANQVLEGRVYWSLASNAWGVTTGTLPERALAPTTTVLLAGYYPETEIAAVETNLQPDRIAKSVVLFGVTGTQFFASAHPAPVPRTGATNSLAPGDDGDRQTGVPWPEPRFTPLSGPASNCVIDNLTGLMWIRSPDGLAPENNTYYQHLNFCNALDGTGGRGGYTDWRMPNIRELFSLVDLSRASPALPVGHPFHLPTGGNLWAWSSTVQRGGFVRLLIVESGRLSLLPGTSTDAFPWPVRGGGAGP